MSFLWPFVIGFLSGLRSLTPIALVSWAAHLKWIHLEDTWLAFLGFTATPYILTVLAIGELVADKLPSTPSRKAAVGFSARVVTGALCGAAIGVTILGPGLNQGLGAGIVGAVAGTFGGYEFRTRLTKAAGNGLVIALLEDVIAIGGAYFIVR